MSEEKVEKFVNKTDSPVRVKILDSNEKLGFRWAMVQPDEVIELPINHGKAYGFKSTVEKPKPKAKPKKKEKNPANLEDSKKTYHKKLLKVKGVGEKTARDLEQVYPTEEHLKYAIKKGSKLPIRDDLEKEIVRTFK